MLGKFIDAKTFIISLAIGFLLVYITKPTPKVISVYPTLDNMNNIKYKDKAGTCFKFKAQSVSCDKNSNKISTTPFQE